MLRIAWIIPIGPGFVPLLELIAFLTTTLLSGLTWLWLSRTCVGKALRACAEDPHMAAAFGIHQKQLSFALSGLCSAFAAVAGVFVALISTLAPSQIWSWLGVIFAVVIIGRLGNPIGLLLASMAIGAGEGLAMAVFSPSWAPMVAFCDSFLYVVFYWISLARSWALLSGFAGNFSLGHAAYVGAGMYTSATLTAKFDWPFLVTVPVAALVATSLGTAIGLLVFRACRGCAASSSR